MEEAYQARQAAPHLNRYQDRMKPLTPFKQDVTTSTFAEDFEHSMQRLRGALTDLLAAAGEDPRQPQEISRNCDLNKNLAWKVSKIVNSTDAYSCAQHVPGSAGIRILLAAFERRGVSAEVLRGVEEAIDQFDRMIRVHVGDRGNLELYVGSVQEDGIHSSQLEVKRRMAYQGNCVIWGVQARVAYTLKVISPNATNPERADIATVGGLLGFRRLRPTASWPVLRMRTLSEDVEIGHDWRPINPAHEGTSAPLIPGYCSTPLPETRSIVEGERTTHEICEGPVGNTAAVDVAFGGVDLSHVPVRTKDLEAIGEHYCRSDTPVEMLQFDLLVHRDLPFQLPPKLVTYSSINGDQVFPLSKQDRFHLPSTDHVNSLGPSMPAVSSPHIPRYGKLVHTVCERMGRDLGEFTGYRMTLSYPPIPAIFVMHHKLGSPIE